MRTNRQGRYFDLLKEAGACDASGNGRELTDDDLKDLDQASRDLGKSERTLADDLAAAVRFHQLRRQLSDTEAATPGAEKRADQIMQRIESLSKERCAMAAPRRENHEATREYNNKRSQIEGEITKLQNDHKAARRPLVVREVLPKQISALVAANPWLKGKR